jgi:hypothetical protein
MSSERKIIVTGGAGLVGQNPGVEVTDANLIDSRARRLRYAQPVRPPGFGAAIPPAQTIIAGLQIADTCSYYSDDRSISESVRIGRLPACAIDAPQ